MTTYSTVKGFTIQELASDPSNPIVGQVWFNNTATVLKGYGQQGTGAWASGSNLLTARTGLFGFGASPSDASAVGGNAPPSSALNEQYDGTSWSEQANIQTARSTESRTGAGTQAAGLIYGSGAVVTTSESWNGSSWATITGYTTARRASGGTGIQTAAINFGGSTAPGANDSKLNEEWNGSSWSEKADLNTARYAGNGMGTATSALYVDGYVTSGSAYQKICESYDGSSWSEVGNTNSHHSGGGGSSAGSNTLCLVWGGVPGAGANAEEWNGTSWTEVGDLATPVSYPQSAGTTMSAISAGGAPAGAVNATEVWAIPDAIKTFTAS